MPPLTWTRLKVGSGFSVVYKGRLYVSRPTRDGYALAEWLEDGAVRTLGVHKTLMECRRRVLRDSIAAALV